MKALIVDTLLLVSMDPFWTLQTTNCTKLASICIVFFQYLDLLPQNIDISINKTGNFRHRTVLDYCNCGQKVTWISRSPDSCTVNRLPETGLDSCLHRSCGFGAPYTRQVNVTVWPSTTFWSSGVDEKLGAAAVWTHSTAEYRDTVIHRPVDNGCDNTAIDPPLVNNKLSSARMWGPYKTV